MFDYSKGFIQKILLSTFKLKESKYCFIVEKNLKKGKWYYFVTMKQCYTLIDKKHKCLLSE